MVSQKYEGNTLVRCDIGLTIDYLNHEKESPQSTRFPDTHAIIFLDTLYILGSVQTESGSCLVEFVKSEGQHHGHHQTCQVLILLT